MRTPASLRRAVALAVASSLVIGLLAAVPAVLAAGAAQSTTSLGQWSIDPVPAGMTSQITATVSGQSGTPTGDVEFSLDAVVVQTTTLDVNGQAVYTLPADASAGTHQLRAHYLGDGTYVATEATTSIFVGPRDVLVALSVPASASPGEQISATVTVTDAGTTGSVPVAGHITIQLDGNAMTPVASFDLPTTQATIDTTGWTAGVHQLRAFYDPGLNTDHNAGASPNQDITLAVNTLDVTGVGVQYATFYPYKDGYRDTDAIRGTRNETAKVAIRIYNSKGKLVRSASVASGIGTWSFAWNGRTAGGAALAAGKYTVRQVVTDSKNLSKTFTSFITFSSKRLYTYTIALRKTAKQLARNGGTWFGWTFTLPSATVYKKLVFSVYGQSGLPAGLFGPHNYAVCPSTTVWSYNTCMTPWTTFPTTASWKSVTGHVKNNRHGTTVRMYAVGGTRTAVAYARVTVTYQVLR
ncbi:MAG: Ig-like domain-containing protein [Chloroflexota bacterium]